MFLPTRIGLFVQKPLYKATHYYERILGLMIDEMNGFSKILINQFKLPPDSVLATDIFADTYRS